jgi:glycosyltransferase involved in cell wall biosynthesis
MEKDIKISFVIPAHNEEKYLGRCLKSLEQALAGFEYKTEVVVVNNASDDRTKEVALSFPWVKVIDEPQKGLPRARQAGYLASTGELIANIDADTILLEGWLETVINEFNRNKKLVALSGPFIYYDLPVFSRALVKFYYFLGLISHLFNHFILGAGAMLQGGNFILRREALDQIKGFDSSIEFYGEDTDIARRISKVGRVKWTFKLPMYTSARRLKGEGMLTMAIRYPLNYFSILIFKKPLTKTHRVIR